MIGITAKPDQGQIKTPANVAGKAVKIFKLRKISRWKLSSTRLYLDFVFGYSKNLDLIMISAVNFDECQREILHNYTLLRKVKDYL